MIGGNSIELNPILDITTPSIVKPDYLRESHNIGDYRLLAQRFLAITPADKKPLFLDELDNLESIISKYRYEKKDLEAQKAINLYKSSVALLTNPDFSLRQVDWRDMSLTRGSSILQNALFDIFELRTHPAKKVWVSFSPAELPQSGLLAAFFLMKYYYAEKGWFSKIDKSKKAEF